MVVMRLKARQPEKGTVPLWALVCPFEVTYGVKIIMLKEKRVKGTTF